ncbi:MAG: phospho-sugar mutase [Oscillospiraceae bacterium]|nr:phospho-sugar mutase [Oscillospiraceae bacterium]MCL2278301.1 phospho-sugar mutase [Oscillospiraceae bacterium]
MMNTTFSKWKAALKDTSDGQVLDNMTQDELSDAFSGNISFGTGGLRGVMGIGASRINRYTIERVTVGLAKVILSSDVPKRVGVAYDTRHNSSAFAESVCKALAAYGIETYSFSEPMPTPTLSYAIRLLGLGWGVVITASHNPQEYNGYKVYDSHGVQLTDEMAKEVTDSINTVEFFEPLPDTLHSSINTFSDVVVEAYISQITAYAGMDNMPAEFPFIYSALHGAGARIVPKTLTLMGFSPICIQLNPDGAFGGLHTPNPEEPGVYESALSKAKKTTAKLLLTTDPDCDRAGVMVKTDSDFLSLSGNQIGALLIDYLAKTKGVAKGDTVISTIVSGTLGEAVAESYGLEFVRLLTGFKYIGEYIVNLPEDKRFFFGYEESYGYLSGDGAKDKDAVMASALIVKMAAFYDAKGMTLHDRWLELSEKHGYHLENLHSATVAQDKQKEIMKKLRIGIPIADLIRLDDYAAGFKGLPPADTVKLIFNDGAWAAIRPSGTEPKLKIYTGVCMNTHEAAKEALEALAENLLSALGLTNSQP